MKSSGRGLTWTSLRSAPTRGPWIEMPIWSLTSVWASSAPTRGPWIEIYSKIKTVAGSLVGPHTGAVD